jgi:hypothetical protein
MYYNTLQSMFKYNNTFKWLSYSVCYRIEMLWRWYSMAPKNKITPCVFNDLAPYILCLKINYSLYPSKGSDHLITGYISYCAELFIRMPTFCIKAMISVSLNVKLVDRRFETIISFSERNIKLSVLLNYNWCIIHKRYSNKDNT